MNTLYRSLSCALLAGAMLLPAFAAATISRITFTSNGGSYINDSIVDGTTSPLAFTAQTGLAQPFLNAGDSTITLGYGSYYAITFRTFGAHIGPGTVSFLLNGVTPYSQNVTFPDPTSASGVFASFTLPGGDSVTISASGLAADRIRVVADGAGLFTDGTPDAFYVFNYTAAVTFNSQSDCLFNWAQGNYPSLFAPATSISNSLASYYYRYYSQTGAYLATSSDDNHVYYLGPLSSYAVLDLGTLSLWLSLAGCQ